MLVRGRLGTLLGPEGTAGRLFVQGRYGSRHRLRVGVRLEWRGLVPLRQTVRCMVPARVAVGRVGAGVRVSEPVVA